MLGYLRRGLILAALGAVGLASPGATAAEELHDDQILVLGILQENRSVHERLTAALVESLSESEKLVKADDLRPGERQCRLSVCLNQLASARQATMVLWGDIKRLDKKERRVMLKVYDMTTSRFAQEPLTGTDEHVESILADGARRLMKKYRSSAAAAESGSERGGLEVPIKICDSAPTKPAWRTGLAVALGALGLATLGVSVGLTVLNHQAVGGQCSYNGLNSSCVAEYMPLFTTGYVVAALSGVGLGLTVGLR